MIARARKGDWSVGLTEKKAVPRSWFPPDLHRVDVLGLASGGGQQGPGAGSRWRQCHHFDNSPRQLDATRSVALREGLVISTVEGDMRDLHSFSRQQLRPHLPPGIECVLPGSAPVYHEAFRVLRSGGILMAGFMNPAMYIF